MVASVLATFFVLASAWIGCTAEDELSLQAAMTPVREFPLNSTPKSVDLYSALSSMTILSCELIRHFDYPCQISHVTTEDGYVLEVERVPWGRQDNATSPNEQNGTLRHPVLLLPVFMSASDMWFFNYPRQSLGFLFADAGFDVWLMNTRDIARYANHTTLSMDDPEYWKFSRSGEARRANNGTKGEFCGSCWKEVGARHSGVTATLVLLSTRPEYNDKVDLVVAYGPVANASHIGPPMSLMVPFTPLIARMIYPFSRAGYLETDKGLSEFLAKVCVTFTGEACSLSITLTLFSSPYQLNETRMPVYVGHYPVGTTIQNVMHLYQIYKAKDFVMYDHGAKENRKRYGQPGPPAYPLERITAPWAIFSSEGDRIANPRDVADLVARLGPRVLMHRVVPHKAFRHMDFGIGYRANEFLHDIAIDVIKNYTDQSI
ncbi:hypothetical protein HPB50_027168 [Hyalomma asiaticum]|uniref:Uncharacterized protein n=1 Tax=Hyalomma asiaticum TaxID=266040 RepID=A0ACB7RT77_HYAAI|nr:hypothetical protein HPB50_027168 [Hyalomma asiaticum]